MNFRIVSIHGVPRSGTSWLGQIFNSHPNVTYRHQPLFAYRFKDRINLRSTKEEILSFLRELYNVTEDDFILDVERRKEAEEFWVNAKKEATPAYLVMKMVRYHHLLRLFLEDIEDIKVIGIVRHPCAVINSWLQAPKEFRPEWNPLEEWRYASKKNAGRIEEFNGFEKWKEVAQMFLEFEKVFSDRFTIVKYEDLIHQTEREVFRLFSFVGLDMPEQTYNFVKLTRQRHSSNPYSVFKDPCFYRRWEKELDKTIYDEIIGELKGTVLERFLE